jgi:hypothetical protein
MEAPSNWTKARNAILRGAVKAQDSLKSGEVGHSESALIEQELLKEGFLTPDSQEVVGFKDPHQG